jgi:hypothetical protein
MKHQTWKRKVSKSRPPKRKTAPTASRRVVELVEVERGGTRREQRLESFGNLAGLLKSKKVVFPPELQRKFCWSDNTIREFFESAAAGFNFFPIIIVDIAQSMQFCQEIGDQVSYEWFKKYQDQGYRYVGFDGQNRLKSILNVFSNKVTLTGLFQDADEKFHQIENRFFKDIPIRLQDRLRDSLVNLITVNEITVKEMSIQFRRLQGGYALNPQECRNASCSPMAELIRDLAEKYCDSLARVVNPEKAKRLLDHELVAKSIYAIYKPADSLSDTSIDRFYEIGEDFISLEDKGINYDMNQLECSIKAFDFAMRVIKNQKKFPPSKMISSRMFWALMLVSDWIENESGLTLPPKNAADFFDALYELDKELYDKSEVEVFKKKKASAKKGEEFDGKGKYYLDWTRVPHQSTYRKRRRDALVAEITKDYGRLHLRLKK